MPGSPALERVRRVSDRDRSYEAPGFWQMRKRSDALLDEVGVLCLTSKPTNTVMWAHYADDHCGICLEYTEVDALAERVQASVAQVQYGPERPALSPFSTPRDQWGARMVSMKQLEWQFEEEWRVVHWLGVRSHGGFFPTKVILGGKTTSEDEEEVRSWVAGMQEGRCPQIIKASLSRTEYAVDLGGP
jgi:hypothetical protein